ncbi:ABC transporter permease [Exiguobacterium flavidum]|uniref:ABC transporter permease n=1 Tax=Exiguobacterium flavidum TaxID=2184695 RepID=UPI000DF8274C|nr:ABC transporter permease [Exiguobacterium flavidum]
MWKEMKNIVAEQIAHFPLIRRLARYEIKSTHAEQKLGLLWELLNPGLQILIYWFVFGVGLRGNSHVDGTPFIVWMLAGIVVWFFVNDALLRGSNSINSRLAMVTKMRFPMSAIPSYVILSRMYQHLAMIVIVLVVVLLNGIPLTWKLLQLPYYLFSTYVFVYAVSLFFSTLVTLVKDIQNLLQSVMRMLFYMTPILWTIDTFPDVFHGFLRLNPVYYLVEGYRASLLGGSWLWQEWPTGLYFWSVTLLLFTAGTFLHIKFRKSFTELV